MTFVTALTAWIENSDDASWESLRAEIQNEPTYNPGADFSASLDSLAAGDHETARDTLVSMMPGAFMSPLAHSLLARVWSRVGRADLAAQEEAYARAALISILNSGDGTEEHPWKVLRVSDEYDVLEALGERATSQRCLADPVRTVDCLTTDSGTERWFVIRRAPQRPQEVIA